jgi:Uma2 family endonuclease
MATVSSLMTAAQLEALPSDDFRYELIRGELFQMSPAGREHGKIALIFARHFSTFIELHDLGEVYMAETGFILRRNPDTVRAPDCAFVATERLAEIEGVKGYIPIAPDLAVEVISPNDRYSEVDRKVQDWLAFGVRTVVVINPRTQLTTVYHPNCEPVILNRDETLELPEVAPGWSFALRELFE